MSKKKIVMAVFNNGVSDSRVFREASTLGSLGYEVVVYALHDEGLPFEEDYEYYHLRRIRVRSRSIKRLPLWVKALELSVLLFFLGIRERADCYHAHDLHPLPILFAVSRLVGGRLVYDSHELNAERSRMSARTKRLNRRLERWLVPKADLVIMSAGDSGANHLADAVGINPSRIVDIGNYPITVNAGETGQSSLPQRVGIPFERPIMAYVGAIVPGRGLEASFKALARLETWHMVVFGRAQSKEYLDSLLALAASLGASERIHFAGVVPPTQVAAAIQGATVGLALIENTSLSYYYSRPTKLFEYMLAGVPVIGSDFPEIRKCLVDNPVGQVGVVVAPDDVAGLTDALIWIETHPQEAADYGEAGRRVIKEHWNWETQAEKLGDAYKKLGFS